MPRLPKKTRDEIINANLRRMLNKLKARVAESEEIWLDMFETVLPLVIGDVEEIVGAKDEWWKGKIARAASVTDDILTEYERRWGGGERKGTGE